MEETLINGKTLSFYLRHPGALKLVERNELIRLIELYPYSAHLHLLLTVKDHLENNTANQDLLERAALYISDRRKLGEWMNKLQSLRQDEGLGYDESHLESLSRSLETLEEKDEHIVTGTEELPVLDELDFAESPDYDTLEPPDLTGEEIWVEKVTIPKEGLSEKEITVTISGSGDLTKPEGTIVEEGPAAEELPQEPVEEETPAGEPAIPETGDVYPGEVEVPVTPEILPKEEEEEEEEERQPGVEVPLPEEHLEEEEEEMETIGSDENVPGEPDERTTADSGEPERVISGEPPEEEHRTPFLRWLQRLETTEGPGYEDLESRRRRQLLERAEERKPEKAEKKKKKKKKKKKSWKMESLLPDETLVSESLADLLASQGHTERAIEMYEKLRLTIPEKSVFFAQKIKALEQKK